MGECHSESIASAARARRYLEGMESWLADGVETFAQALEADPVRIDLGALAIASHVGGRSRSDVDAALDSLDRLGERLRDPTFDGLIEHLFREQGFVGELPRGHNPAACYLDTTLVSRRGLPVVVSAVAMEVARRAGVTVEGIGMPGLFMIRSSEGTLFDTVRRRPLDERDAQQIFERMHPSRSLEPRHLQPVSNVAILRRMLMNLRAHHTKTLSRLVPPYGWLVRQAVRRRGPARPARARRSMALRRSMARQIALEPLIRVMELLVCFPDARPSHTHHLAQMLLDVGRVDDAATCLEAAAERASEEEAETFRAGARALRARLN